MNRADLITEVSNKLLSGGRRTTAAYIRELVTDTLNSIMIRDSDANAANGYMAIDSSGRAVASFLNVASPLGYFLRDDGTWQPASGGASNLFAVLTAGNSTGGLSIVSPDSFSQLNVIDTQSLLGHYGATISGETYASLSGSGINWLDSGSSAGGSIFIIDSELSITHSAFLLLQSPSIQWSSDMGTFAEGWMFGDNTGFIAGFGGDSIAVASGGITLDHATKIDFISGTGYGRVSTASSYIGNTIGGFFASEGFLVIPNYIQTKAAGTYIVHDTLISLDAPVINGTSLVLSSFLNEAKGSNIASAATTDIGAATGNFVHITGTTTITALGTVQAGTRRVVTFDGVLTLTYNATSLILPGSANIITEADDCAIFESEGSGNWRCVSYQRKSGGPVVREFDIMCGSLTVFSPLDSSVTFVGPSTPLAPSATDTVRQFRGIDGTIFECVIYVDPTATIGSNEAVTYDLWNVTDGILVGTLGTITYDQRGNQKEYGVSLATLSTKDYSVRITNPAYGTNPSNCYTTIRMKGRKS